jgi:GNAT superfamily N-acetyltransferase
MAEFSIREAEAADAPTVLSFLRLMVEEMAMLGGHPAAQKQEVWLRLGRVTREEIGHGQHLYLLAELPSVDPAAIGLAEGSVINPAPVFDLGRVLHIHALYVDRDHRRLGVGRALLEALLDWGRGQGCVEAELNVLVGSTARPLYEGSGFSPFQMEMRREL